MTRKLFLLDAYALIYRAYFAFIRNPRYNSKGLNTSAVFGFVNTLEEVLRLEKPTHIAVVFDPPGPNFRHELYPEYKAHREAMPEDLRASIPYIKELIQAYNIPIIEVPGFEADDVIGTLSVKASDNGFNVYMMTPDKDYCQLVSESVFIYKPRKGGVEPEVWGIPEVQKSFEVKSPDQVIDILGLMGDSSDNIPGAEGIGEKTAKKLIAEFDSIENIYANLDSIKGKQQEKLAKSKDKVFLSRTLVTIEKNVPLTYDEQSFLHDPPNIPRLKELFAELEFRTFLDKLGPEPVKKDLATAPSVVQGSLFDMPPTQFSNQPLPVSVETDSRNNISSFKHEYKMLVEEKEHTELVKELLKAKSFCFDTETTGLNSVSDRIVGISFCADKKKAFYIPVPQGKTESFEILSRFSPLFENNKQLKIGQNLKFDLMMLANHDIKVSGPFFDTMIASYILDPESKHGLDFLAGKYLDYKMIPIEELIGKRGRNQKNMKDLDPNEISDYACEDAHITYLLCDIIKKEIDNSDFKDLFYNIEIPLIEVLAAMEQTGVKINEEELNAYAGVLNKTLIDVESKIIELAGENFNLSSPRQLGYILFDKLEIISKAKKTKTKQYSTSEDVLITLSGKHEIIDYILEHRKLKKLLSTYVEALPRLINADTGRIHASFNQARVATGRLSSENPNLQNIPIREEQGREVRKSFVPTKESNLFLSADYSQIELRIMAHLSKDPVMVQAFCDNKDIHAETAAKIYQVMPEFVTKEMRNHAKTANFGILYGISAFGLADRLKIKRADAKSLIDGYFNTYKRVARYIEECLLNAREHGYVETIMGRRRYLKDINSRNATIRGLAERNAINAPVQGSSSDIIKLSMVNIYNRFIKEGLDAKMIIQVHDELNFDVPESELEQVKDIIKHEMENAVKLDVPLVVDIGVGKNWYEAH